MKRKNASQKEYFFDFIDAAKFQLQKITLLLNIYTLWEVLQVDF
jgi:hypothetical protein